jgi:hypothetical protein
MTNFVETRDTRNGTASLLSNVQLNWLKVIAPVPGYNGGKPQYELQIATQDTEQAQAWKSIMPNLRISEDVTTFTLKRPSFLGAPAMVNADGDIMEMSLRKTIGNGSIGDVKVSHKQHPKTGTPYVCLEAVRVTEIATFIPDNSQYENDFDF